MSDRVRICRAAVDAPLFVEAPVLACVDPTGMQIGAHVSVAAGVEDAVERQLAVGGNCGQIFTTSPQVWQGPKIEDGENFVCNVECALLLAERTYADDQLDARTNRSEGRMSARTDRLPGALWR